MDELCATRQDAAALTSGRVGIVTQSFASTYYSALVDAASSLLLSRGFHVLVQSNMRMPSGGLEAWTALEARDCNGMIVHAEKLEKDELNLVMEKHPNIVLINHHLPLYHERCIDTDNVRGGEIAARFLVQKGHRDIAMVSGPPAYLEVIDRSAGFKRELEAHELVLCVELRGDFVQDGGESAMEQILCEHPNTTAVFFQNDEMAFGGLNACKRLGIRVPEDISIIGFDGIPMCEYVYPTLSSVQQPLRELGEHAAKVVSDLLLNKARDKRTVGTTFPHVLVERESVAPRIGHRTDRVALTKRETECLLWTARGKTSWEISVILGFSESTATFHLRNAGSKLKACNRANAVAKAIHLGLINFTDN